eukprot:335508-Chlamydomonas_euryale.AAC.2
MSRIVPPQEPRWHSACGCGGVKGGFRVCGWGGACVDAELTPAQMAQRLRVWGCERGGREKGLGEGGGMRDPLLRRRARPYTAPAGRGRQAGE